MSRIAKAFEALANGTTTTNGAFAYKRTGSKVLDFFAKAGSLRTDPNGMMRLFEDAFLESPELAFRAALWLRDCRGGAGERNLFKTILTRLDSDVGHNPAFFDLVVNKVVELGRWDDVFVIQNNFDSVVRRVVKGLENPQERSLVCKWLPREKSAKKALAHRFASELGLTSKAYRKMLSSVETVETLLCSKRFNEINLSFVPSVASKRYQKAFERNCEQYAEWKAGLATGQTKVNASVLYPYDVLKMTYSGADSAVCDATWNALPNYLQEGISILPVVDVSGSMGKPAAVNLSCIEVSISLGTYLSMKCNGPFKNKMITFSEQPTIVEISANQSIRDVFYDVKRIPWGYNTNFEAVFTLLLNLAKATNATQEDMPEFIAVLSDMQFDEAKGAGGNFAPIAKTFESHFEVIGLKMPKLIYWNLNADAYSNTAQAKRNSDGAICVSGFSPAIMSSVISGKDVTPYDMMLDVIMNERYSLV